MTAYIFTYWYKSDSNASYNRINSFYNEFVRNGYAVKIICTHNSDFNNYSNENIISIERNHLFYQIFIYLKNKKMHILSNLIHFFYLTFTGRDIYDFFKLFKNYQLKNNINFLPQDIIITTSPPYSCLDIGNYIKINFKSKWFCDYRDPWTLGYNTIGYFKISGLFRKLIQRNKEHKFLEKVDEILTISEPLKKHFGSKFKEKVHIVENGACIEKIEFNKIIDKPKEFTIIYLGQLYDIQLESCYFFDILSNFITNNNANVKLYFIGTSISEKLLKIINQKTIGLSIEVKPYMYNYEHYELMYQANIFLQLKYGNKSEIITTKQYEYLAFQKPILLPETDDGELSKSIIQNDVGIVCNSEIELYHALNSAYFMHLQEKSFRILKDSSFLNAIDRSKISNKLTLLIKDKYEKIVNVNEVQEKLESAYDNAYKFKTA